MVLPVCSKTDDIERWPSTSFFLPNRTLEVAGYAQAVRLHTDDRIRYERWAAGVKRIIMATELYLYFYFNSPSDPILCHIENRVGGNSRTRAAESPEHFRGVGVGSTSVCGNKVSDEK